MLNLTINGSALVVSDGTTILEAAKKVGIRIPTLCHLDLHEMKMVNQVASCRVCMVEVQGRRGLVPACSTTVTEGMVVQTDTIRALKARRIVVELLRNLTGSLVAASGDSIDAVELQSLFDQADHASSMDALTGLLDRNSVDVRLPRELDRAHSTRYPLSLILISLDGFA